jgi:transposase
VATHQFLEFLEELSVANGHEPLAVFMDNMTVHHSRLALQKYQELGITPIFNVPYSPQFNGIESVFSMVRLQQRSPCSKTSLKRHERKGRRLSRKPSSGLIQTR